jgi:macrolide transport system ATP-binding/permease protein
MHLSASAVSKTYEPVPVLTNVSFVVSGGERVGIVGANGSGKSTLLRILAGELEADSGHVSVPANATVGYLPQDPPEPDNATVDDLIYSAAGNVRDLETRLRDLEAQMASAGDDSFEDVVAEYGEVLERFERSGGYDIDHRVDLVCSGLRISGLPRDRSFTTLSGGEKARVLLATLLLTSPDVLLLDEPTNHLDFGSIGWLEGFLSDFTGILIVVSHDRRFLNTTVSRIIEIDENTHRAREYAGNYDRYAVQKEREREQWEADFAVQQDELTELRRAIRQARAGVDRKAPPPRDADKNIQEAHKARADKTASKGIRSLEERLRRIETDPVSRPPAMLRMNPKLDQGDLQSDEVVRFNNVSIGFDGVIVLSDVSFTLRRGERVVLVGPNGAGKSTILNLIAGRLDPDSGQVHLATAARPGYLDQDAAGFEPQQTVFNTYRAGLNGLEHELISDLFRFGLFTYDDLGKQVRQLSTGQRRKLQIARLVAEGANMLLLDEPTNHLSLNVLEDFERALRDFPGPVLAASHDRHFIERFGSTVWEVNSGKVIKHHGDVPRTLEVLAQVEAAVRA